MDARPVAWPAQPPQPARDGAGTHLTGRRVAAARGLWLALVVPGLALFGVAIPARFQELTGLAGAAAVTLPQVAPTGALFDPALLVSAYPPAILALEIGFTLLYSLTALLIFWRRSDDWIALYVSGTMVLFALYVNPSLDALLAAPAPWRLATTIVQALGLGSAILFFFIFPDGRLRPGWWRGLIGIWAVWTALSLADPAGPVTLSRPFDLPVLWFGMMMVIWCAGMAAQIYCYRRCADPVQRQQTKWIVFGVTAGVIGYGVLMVSTIVLSLLPQASGAILLFRLTGVPAQLICLLSVPIAFAFSILRYRLWDIDLLINRALVYATLTLTLALAYGACVILLHAGFRFLTGQRSGLIVVASTLAIAVLFQPLRRRIQTFIDRRFYRRRYDATRTLAAFGATLRDEVDLVRLTDNLVGVVEETMQPAHVSLWLRQPERPRERR